MPNTTGEGNVISGGCTFIYTCNTVFMYSIDVEFTAPMAHYETVISAEEDTS